MYSNLATVAVSRSVMLEQTSEQKCDVRANKTCIVTLPQLQ